MQSLERALDILEVLSDSNGKPVKLGEISSKTGLTKPTANRILKTLCDRHYACKISQSAGYQLGYASYYLTRHGRYGQKLTKICSPYLRWLHKKTGGTPLLTVLGEQKKLTIDYIQGNFILSQNPVNLLNDEIYSSCSGRLLLSGLSASELQEYLVKYGLPEHKDWPEAGSLDQMKEELKKIKKNGFSFVVHKEPQARSAGYSVPLICGGKMIGALGLAVALSEEDSLEMQAELMKLLLFCQKKINEILEMEEMA